MVESSHVMGTQDVGKDLFIYLMKSLGTSFPVTFIAKDGCWKVKNDIFVDSHFEQAVPDVFYDS